MEHQDPVNSHAFFLGDPEPGNLGDLLKRSVDMVGSVGGILILSPLMLIIAAAIKMTSPGPVIFKQTRMGKRGVPFIFYKFRSMSANADDRIHREYVASLINGNHAAINQGDTAKPLYKIKWDPRVTRVGSIIRKTSMDELPQLFNVLRGDMSLVGPRPPIPYEAEKYEAWHLRRILEIRPGITGLWQVEGRSKTSFDDMVRMDLRYIRNCSPMFDLKILLRTIKVVLKREGAT
jgi:exopolysaccharide biosynthesis polyprenyl glycosylphosphotransferase